MVLGNIGRTIRDSISGTIRGTGDILEDTVSAARSVTVGALSGSREVIGDVQGLVADVVKGTIHATGDVGAEVGSTAKGAIIGVIRGVGEVATVTVEVCSDTVRAAIKGTSEVGDDFSGHSGRIGMARRMVAAGAPTAAVQQQGRWKHGDMVARYARGESAGEALRWLTWPRLIVPIMSIIGSRIEYGFTSPSRQD